ncbi:MAG: C39 family peptidase [Pseudomonadota bacterium]
MTRTVRLAALLCAVLAVTAAPAARAAGTAPILAEPGRGYVMPVRTIKEMKLARAFRTTVHQQYDFSCGSAAVATLLTYHYGSPVDEATVFQAMYSAGDQGKIRREGFSLLDMKRFLEAGGYKADGVQVSLDELAKARVPAIALISDNGYRHFVVVKGVHQDRVVVGDPAIGTRILSREQFETSRLGGIFFVIRSHLSVAKFNAPGDWNGRLGAPLSLGVARDSLAGFTLSIPDANSF